MKAVSAWFAADRAGARLVSMSPESRSNKRRNANDRLLYCMKSSVSVVSGVCMGLR